MYVVLDFAVNCLHLPSVVLPAKTECLEHSSARSVPCKAVQPERQAQISSLSVPDVPKTHPLLKKTFYFWGVLI